MNLNNGRVAGNGEYTRKRTSLNVMVFSRPKVLDHMSALVPEIMDGSLYRFLRIRKVGEKCEVSGLHSGDQGEVMSRYSVVIDVSE
jgi:hypothetical protein